MTQGPSARRRDRASALIVVIWIIGLLSMLVAGLAFDAHIEARILSYYRKRTQAGYLARSGIELAEYLLRGSGRVEPRAADEPPAAEADEAGFKPEMQNLRDDRSVSLRDVKLGAGKIDLDILPTPSYRNIAALKTAIEWKGILVVAEVPEEMHEDLIDAVLDWIDEDPESRRVGFPAETDDWYAERYEDYLLRRQGAEATRESPPPARARNAPLQTIGELRTIKGFASNIVIQVEGEEPRRGDEVYELIKRKELLTSYGDPAGKVNVNSASHAVLQSLPIADDEVSGFRYMKEMTTDIAQDVILLRTRSDDPLDKSERGPFTSIDDFFDRLRDVFTDSERAVLGQYITTEKVAEYYKITAVGEVQGVMRKIACTVTYSDGGDFRVMEWHEEE